MLRCYALHPAYTTTLTAQHAEAKLKAARIAAQTRLVEARAVLERQCEARLAEAAQQAAAQLEAVRAAATRPALFNIPRGGRRAESAQRVKAHDVRSFHPGQ